MTGYEVIVALELIRRGMKAATGIYREADEFGELLTELKEKISGEDDEKVVEEKVTEVAKLRNKNKRIAGRYAGIKRM